MNENRQAAPQGQETWALLLAKGRVVPCQILAAALARRLDWGIAGAPHIASTNGSHLCGGGSHGPSDGTAVQVGSCEYGAPESWRR